MPLSLALEPAESAIVSGSRVLFSSDASYCTVLTSRVVKVFDTRSGELASTLDVPSAPSTSHAESLELFSAYMLNPHNPMQLITGSSTGHIRVWDFIEGSLLRTIRLDGRVTHLHASVSTADSVYAAIDCVDEGKDNDGRSGAAKGGVFLVNPHSFNPVSTGNDLARTAGMRKIAHRLPLVDMRLDADGSILYLLTRRRLYARALKDHSDRLICLVRSEEPFTAFDVHPQMDTVACGTASGKIKLFHAVHRHLHDLSTEASATLSDSTTLHWHAHKVAMLAFDSDGSQFVSVGQEAVAVIWTTDSGHQEFVPRLGAPAAAVSHSPRAGVNNYFAVLLMNGDLVLISKTTLLVSKRLHSGSNVSQARVQRGALSLCVSKGGQTMVRANDGYLDLLKTSSFETLVRLQMSPRNTTPKPRHGTARARPLIASTEEVIVTAETDELDREAGLKLWLVNQKQAGLALSARVAQAHLGGVIGLVTNPQVAASSAVLLTVGRDRSAKLWSNSDTWKCLARLSYQALPISSATWSPDGSIVVLLHPAVLSVWSALSGRRLGVCNPRIGKLSEAAFDYHNSTSFLVTGQKGSMRISVKSLAVTHFCSRVKGSLCAPSDGIVSVHHKQQRSALYHLKDNSVQASSTLDSLVACPEYVAFQDVLLSVNLNDNTLMKSRGTDRGSSQQKGSQPLRMHKSGNARVATLPNSSAAVNLLHSATDLSSSFHRHLLAPASSVPAIRQIWSDLTRPAMPHPKALSSTIGQQPSGVAEKASTASPQAARPQSTSLPLAAVFD